MKIGAKILSLGAVGLIAVLLVAGIAMAAGPADASANGNAASDACGTCDRDQDRLQDGSCDGTSLRAQDRDGVRSMNGTCDGTMLMERSGLGDGPSGQATMVRSRSCGGPAQ